MKQYKNDIDVKMIDPTRSSPTLNLPPLPEDESYNFHTMLKPSGSQCNLDCTYCFYLHKEELLDQPKRPRMSDYILEQHIKQYIEANTSDSVVFTWQGGEPTLMGLDFYKKVVKLQKKYKKENQEIHNDLQTNGTLLNDDWCKFLHKNNFLVGLSLDGPEHLHDKYRYTKNKNPTFKNVMHAVDLLHKYNIDFNILCVVNNTNVKHPLEVYRFLRDKVRPHMIQFIPGVEPNGFADVAPGYWEAQNLPIIGTERCNPGAPNSVVTDWTVGAKDWGLFLSNIWDEWFKFDFGRVYVDQFENVISMMFNFGSQKCVTSQICGHSVALEHNGDIYSCDHFVYPEYKLGNISDIHQGELAFSDQQKSFGFNKFESLPKYCNECFFLNMCWGECPRNRFVKTPDGEPGLNYLCSGLRVFYAKAIKYHSVLKQLLNL